jgi:mRNA-degrading endonuclease HigB of HigAB toxin-antitoxin module
MEAIVSQIINEMREYQKNKNIKEQCVTNVSFLYNTMWGFGIKNIKAKSVISVYFDANKIALRICAGHIVLMMDEIIIDPSYEIYCLSGVKYFFTIKELMNYIKNNEHFKTDETFNLKYVIENFLYFENFEKTINGGRFLYADDEYYRELESHILDKMKHCLALA